MIRMKYFFLSVSGKDHHFELERKFTIFEPGLKKT